MHKADVKKVVQFPSFKHGFGSQGSGAVSGLKSFKICPVDSGLIGLKTHLPCLQSA